MSTLAKRWSPPLVLGAIAFSLDFISKSWVRGNLEYGQSQTFIPGFLNLLRTVNSGGAFGIGKGHGITMALLASSIVLAILAWAIFRERSQSPLSALERCGVGVIIGAALGNLFDRVTQNQVTDFLDFAFMQFPVFNVADVLIDVGAALIIIGSLRSSNSQENKQTQSSHSGDCCGREHQSDS